MVVNVQIPDGYFDTIFYQRINLSAHLSVGAADSSVNELQ